MRSIGSSVQCCFSFMAETFENRSKLYKNLKIENEEFLESLRVDLCSDAIISYVLV